MFQRDTSYFLGFKTRTVYDVVVVSSSILKNNKDEIFFLTDNDERKSVKIDPGMNYKWFWVWD